VKAFYFFSGKKIVENHAFLLEKNKRKSSFSFFFFQLLTSHHIVSHSFWQKCYHYDPNTSIHSSLLLLSFSKTFFCSDFDSKDENFNSTISDLEGEEKKKRKFSFLLIFPLRSVASFFVILYTYIFFRCHATYIISSNVRKKSWSKKRKIFLIYKKKARENCGRHVKNHVACDVIPFTNDAIALLLLLLLYYCYIVVEKEFY
jgi:hypothetical protein